MILAEDPAELFPNPGLLLTPQGLNYLVDLSVVLSMLRLSFTAATPSKLFLSPNLPEVGISQEMYIFKLFLVVIYLFFNLFQLQFTFSIT